MFVYRAESLGEVVSSELSAMVLTLRVLKGFDIVYRDDEIVVVAKPSGLAVHRGDAAERSTLMSQVRDVVGCYVYAVNRLDRPTSGLVVFALEARWVSPLQRQFETGRVQKSYCALVRGRPQAQGIVDYPIPRDLNGARVDARTDYAVLDGIERHSWLRLWPRTGRRHQLRRHMKHISHPMIGDVKYGDGRVNREFRSRFGLHRLALHAERLVFAHPRSQKHLDLGATLPPDLAQPLQRMGLVHRVGGPEDRRHPV